MSEPKRIVLLGATGSIGESTLQVVRQHPDRLQLVGLAAGSQKEALAAIAKEFDVHETSLYSEEGIDGLERLATLPEADIILVATTGTVALRPTLAAISTGKDIALANKETLVIGGHLVIAAAKKRGVRVYPIDSEHNAIFQCLEGNKDPQHIRRLILTASGGAFRDTPYEALKTVTPEDALKHPNWSMGPKVTVDAATMANKGLEMIEARWLFDVRPEQIDAVVHPQSLVHSMVEFRDGSIIAQLSPPSMTFAIQHILLYPDRAPGVVETLDFTQAIQLDFRPPDESRFPCLRLARQAMAANDFSAAVFSTANEVAVNAFLQKEVPYLAIPELISDVLSSVSTDLPTDLETLIATENTTRIHAENLLSKYGIL